MKWYNKLNPFNTFSEKKKEDEMIKFAKDYFGEMGIFKDDTYERAMQEDYNPDDMDAEAYERMMTDGQVNAAVTMIKLTLLARGYEVQAQTEETEDVAQFIQDNLDQLDTHFDNILQEMLSAIEYGYSATEKVFEYRDNAIMLKKLKVLDPKTVRVKTDRFGDIVHIKQYIGNKDILIKPEKVIWWAYNKKFGNPYGQSELRRVYKHYFIRDKMYRFANIAYERYGTPLLVGRVNEAKDVPKMQRLLRTINGMSGLAVSGGDSIDAIQGQPVDFTSYIDHHGQQIMTTLLVPPMLINLGQGQGGSYSLSNNQMEMFMFRIQSLQRQLSALLEDQLIRPLVDLNFPGVTDYPKFVFGSMSEEKMNDIANTFKTLIDATVIEPDEEWLRDHLGLPQMSEDDMLRKQEREAAAAAQREAMQRALEGQNEEDEVKKDPEQAIKEQEKEEEETKKR